MLGRTSTRRGFLGALVGAMLGVQGALLRALLGLLHRRQRRGVPGHPGGRGRRRVHEGLVRVDIRVAVGLVGPATVLNSLSVPDLVIDPHSNVVKRLTPLQTHCPSREQVARHDGRVLPLRLPSDPVSQVLEIVRPHARAEIRKISAQPIVDELLQVPVNSVREHLTVARLRFGAAAAIRTACALACARGSLVCHNRRSFEALHATSRICPRCHRR
mmetsp:Transcript_3257/g.8418  ORF Transcript_3257/g.8418 Transcript_3257/m.8418 type:complete len:216 (-) Transcript_3257:410-1057(-)